MKSLQSENESVIEYDKEWIALILMAKNARISKTKVRNFIKFKQHENKLTQNQNS